MKIAICDDDKQTLLQLSALVEAFRHKRDTELTYKTFQCATELLSSMRGGDYDVLLLDVLMPGINGMQAAHEIRSFDSVVHIVFLTFSPEFAVESYGVHAHYYLLKPACAENLFPILDGLLDALKKPEESISIKTQSSIFWIPLKKIEYLEINAKTLYFHLTDGSIQKVRGSLAEYEPTLLSKPDFIKPHRSFLVNIRSVQAFCAKELTTASGKKVPVARDSLAPTKSAYMNYLFTIK